MRIALIFPPYTHKVFSENLSVVDEEFCLAPPIILAYVAAILEKHGHKVILIDCRALRLSKEKTLERLKLFKPDVIGFRAETYHFHDALNWIGYFKHKLKTVVIAGGINLSLYPKETLTHPEIDYGIIGEAVESLPKLMSALEYGDSLSGIAGLAYKKDGDIVINPPKKEYVHFDSYPFPARHLLQNDAYHSFISQLKNFTIMLTSTGCPFRCSFCAIHPNTKYCARSPKNVVDEIEICYRDFNIREIDFFDAVLFLDKQRILEIFKGIKKRNLKIEWSCRSRVDVVDEEILRRAADSGCRQIYYGIESVNKNVLNAIRKDVDTGQIKNTIKLTKKYGIRAMGFFMVGNLNDTKETVRETIDFAKCLGLDFIQVCRTIAKPGTELDRIMIEKTGRDYWRDYVLGKQIAGRLPSPWSNLSERETEKLTKEFYIKFYFRPRIILNRILQLKSFQELKRYIGVGSKMLLQKAEIYSYILTDTSEAERFLFKSNKYLKEARQAKVAIVIPTRNEKENLGTIVSETLRVIPTAHIVIVDDNSEDGTGLLADMLAKKHSNLHVIHRYGLSGLGFAYREGFKFILNNLDSEYIFEMDADLSHNPEYLPIFLHYAKDYDLITGSRFLRKVSIQNRTLWRNIVSKGGKWLINVTTGIRLTDVSTGYRCFRRSLLEKINFDFIKSRGYAFQIETIFIANKMGAAIKELPILFIERRLGKSKMSIRIIIEGIFLIFKLTLKRAKIIELKIR